MAVTVRELREWLADSAFAADDLIAIVDDELVSVKDPKRCYFEIGGLPERIKIDPDRGALSDHVRKFADQKYIQPARASKQQFVDIRAGALHSQLGFKNRLPLICSAIGADKFQDTAGVALVSRTGPHHGSNTTFRFRLTK